jgi:plastocyanin
MAVWVAIALASAAHQGVPRVEVALESFRFAPASIHLRAGQPVVLRLVNRSGGGHNFVAPDFFDSARVGAAVGENGGIEVPAHQVREVEVVPARGRYSLRCTHAFHKMMGMKGEIVVD